MVKRRLFVALVGGVALVLLATALVIQHVGINETAIVITIGMLCGPALAASALVGACSLLGLQPVEIRES